MAKTRAAANPKENFNYSRGAKIRASLIRAAEELEPSLSPAHVDAVITRLLNDIQDHPRADAKKVSLLKRLGKLVVHETYRTALLGQLATGKVMSKVGKWTALIGLVMYVLDHGSQTGSAAMYAGVVTGLIGETLHYWGDVEMQKLKQRNIKIKS